MKQLLKLAQKSFVSNFNCLDFPMKLNFLLTFKCNARCIMCNIWKKENADEFSLKEVEMFFSKSNKFSWLDLSGGEVFLRKDIVDVVEIILKNCKDLYLLHFATNGFLTSKIVPAMEKILKFNPKKLLMTVSLDGYKDIHDEMRGIPGSFEKTLQTFMDLRKMNSRRFKVFLGMTLTEKNVNELEDSFRYVKGIVKDLEYNEFHLNIVQRSSHYYDNLDVASPDPKVVYNTIQDFRKKRGVKLFSPVDYLENRYQKLSRIFLENSQCPLPCQALSTSCFISPTGDVYPCTMYDRSIGNIRDYDYDLKRLLSGEGATKIRDEISKGICPQCWTPCEAYQTIIANFFGLRKNKNLTGRGEHKGVK